VILASAAIYRWSYRQACSVVIIHPLNNKTLKLVPQLRVYILLGLRILTINLAINR